MRQFTLVPKRVLAVFAHPDDAEISAGGTLAAWAATGCAIRLVICTLGEKGVSELGSPELLSVRRSREASDAALAIGIEEVVPLGYPDGEISNDVGLRQMLVSQIRGFRPEVLICPDPTTILSVGGYYNHRDHREVGWASLDSAFPAARMPSYFPTEGSPHAVDHCLLSGTTLPDVVVDISSGLSSKIQAVAAHSSQLEYGVEWLGSALSRRAEEVARGSGLRFAECFRSVHGGG